MAKGSNRIYQLAKDHKVSSAAMVNILRELGFEPKSHMSVATPEMVAAVQKKLAQEKQEAKKEMAHREQVREAVAKTSAKIGGITVADSKSDVAGLMRRIVKKQRKKERRRKKDRRTVDKSAVAKSFKATMANLGGAKTRKRYRKAGPGEVGAEIGAENVLEVNEFMSLAELAKIMDRRPAELIAKLFEMGMMATINQRLDMDTIETVAAEFGFDVQQVAEIGDDSLEDESEENLEPRPPVVTVMGHVDHGKTSLLDFIRETNVVSGEAGAITQHIGAYRVEREGGSITFLDTPGHEAFTAMRARGAHLTDIVVLVVAADDGVRPQTVEAIDHARAADVPIIVAVNKIDRPTADPANIRTQLTEHNLVSEEWGGKTIMVDVSAKTGDGVEKLLEMILLQAEMMSLTADPSIRAQGTVVDAKLEKGRGPVITALVRRGSCAVGDSIVAGIYSGHVRTINDDRDRSLQSIGPSMPAQITGLNGVPQAGDSFMAAINDQEAREITLKRSQVKREHEARLTHGRLTLDRVFDRIKEGQIKEVRLVIKADVDGSVEVLADTLGGIANEEVKTNIIRRGVGTITESDILLAAASDAIVIGFQVSPDLRARDLAQREQVDVRLYDVIYEAEDDVKKALEGLLAPTITEKYVGAAEVRNLFKIPRIGVIAGCAVKDGRINRKDRVRVVRDGTVVYKGTIGSLKRFKDDAKEVKEGFECGIGVENFNDVKVGDIVEAYELVEEARTL